MKSLSVSFLRNDFISTFFHQYTYRFLSKTLVESDSCALGHLMCLPSEEVTLGRHLEVRSHVHTGAIVSLSFRNWSDVGWNPASAFVTCMTLGKRLNFSHFCSSEKPWCPY